MNNGRKRNNPTTTTWKKERQIKRSNNWNNLLLLFEIWTTVTAQKLKIIERVVAIFFLFSSSAPLSPLLSSPALPSSVGKERIQALALLCLWSPPAAAALATLAAAAGGGGFRWWLPSADVEQPSLPPLVVVGGEAARGGGGRREGGRGRRGGQEARRARQHHQRCRRRQQCGTWRIACCFFFFFFPFFFLSKICSLLCAVWVEIFWCVRWLEWFGGVFFFLLGSSWGTSELLDAEMAEAICVWFFFCFFPSCLWRTFAIRLDLLVSSKKKSCFLISSSWVLSFSQQQDFHFFNFSLFSLQTILLFQSPRYSCLLVFQCSSHSNLDLCHILPCWFWGFSYSNPQDFSCWFSGFFSWLIDWLISWGAFRSTG